MDSANSIEKNSARIHRFFDKSIFWESFKQQKIPGILITAIYLIEIILIFANMFIKSGIHIIKSGQQSAYYTIPISLHPIITFTFIIAAPVLVLVAFNFLTKRNACDLWHSLPHKRETVFTSVFLSVAAWLVVIVVGTSVVAMTLGFIIIDNSTTYLLAWLMYILSYFIQSLLMAACFTLAATLTGTIENNIITGLLIAFGPRLIISSVYSAIVNSIPILSSRDSISILSGEYNLLSIRLSMMFRFLNDDSSRLISDFKMEFTPLIYSFVLSMVYAILACVLYKKRKSENAERSSLNKSLHAVFRVSLCMAICVFILTTLFNRLTSGKNILDFPLGSWYVVAVVVYFTYELIATKKFISLARALPGLGIVVLLNVGIFGFMDGVRSYVLSYSPSEDEIESVSVALSNDYRNSYIDYSNIYTQASMKTFLKEPELKAIISKALKENCEKAKENTSEYKKYYNDSYDTSFDNNYSPVNIKINSGSVIKSRQIYIKNATIDKIKEIHNNDKEFQKKMLTVPDIKNNLSIIGVRDVKYGNLSTKTYNGSVQARKEILDVYREELASCSFNELMDKSNSKLADLYLKIYVGKAIYTYPIYSELTPKSYELAMKQVYVSTKKLQDSFFDDLSNNRINFAYSLSVYDKNGNTY